MSNIDTEAKRTGHGRLHFKEYYVHSRQTSTVASTREQFNDPFYKIQSEDDRTLGAA
jgi:hypothetical protein